MCETTKHAIYRAAGVQATVYRTPAYWSTDVDLYYFCCNTCGNCGRRWTGRDPAVDEAMKHVSNHPIS